MSDTLSAVSADPSILKEKSVLDVLSCCGVQLSSTGLTYAHKLSLDDHEAIIDTLIKFHGYANTVLNFALGDAYNAMDRDQGSKKGQVEDRWGEGWYHTLRNYAMVCNRFDATARNPKVRWAIYVEMATLEKKDRDYWTSLALRGEASVRRIRAFKKDRALQKERDARAQQAIAASTDTDSNNVDTEDDLTLSEPQWTGGKFGAAADKADLPLNRPATSETAVAITHPTVGFDEDEDPTEEYHYALTSEHHQMALSIAEALTKKRRRLVTVDDVVADLIETQYKMMTTPYAV